MRILVLSHLFPPHLAGSFDMRCQEVTGALRQRGHELRVLTSNHGLNHEQRDPEVERRLLLNGVFDHPPVTDYGAMKALELRNHEVLKETISEFQPDLLHVWSLQGLSKSLLFALRSSRLPTVYDVADDWLAAGVREDPWLRWWNQEKVSLTHKFARASLEAAGERNRFDETAPTRMMKGFDRMPEVFGTPGAGAQVEPNSIGAFRLDRLYFCSQALKDKTEQAGFRVQHGEVIYPGIRAEQFIAEVKAMAAPVKKFLIVSRLTDRSGVMTAIEALRQARGNGVQATLSICGRGDSDYVAQLRSFVVMNQLPVEFLTVSNAAKDLPAVYRQHDAFLYTAEWDEPFAITPLEAMASGLPVIGTRSGGARELIRHGDNALVFTPGDARELASRLQELQMQPALRHQMAENAQAEVLGKYNQTAVIDQIENYLTTSLEVWQHN